MEELASTAKENSAASVLALIKERYVKVDGQIKSKRFLSIEQNYSN